jgi:hypothetical protein
MQLPSVQQNLMCGRRNKFVGRDDMTKKAVHDLLKLSDLNQKDRIQILLSEYSALRAEIVGRTGFGFQIAAVLLAAITWFMQQQLNGRPWYFWAVMGFVAAGFVLATFVNLRDISRLAFRSKEIEREINSRAGEHLMVWETLSGVVTRAGAVRGFFRLVKPLPRSELPLLDSSYLKNDPTTVSRRSS